MLFSVPAISLDPFPLPLRTDKLDANYGTSHRNHCATSPQKPEGRTADIATGSKVNPDLPFALQIFRIEFYFKILLFTPRFYEKGITKIVIVKMEHRFVVAISIRPYDLTV
jgi:hypothetical protein